MGKDPCYMCATPGVKYTAFGTAECLGCGITLVSSVFEYIRLKSIKALKDIEFVDATFAYERSPFATRISFGEWIVQFKLKMIARP